LVAKREANVPKLRSDVAIYSLSFLWNLSGDGSQPASSSSIAGLATG
jgi:hypothetical protein